MRIAVIGAGNIGGTLGRAWAAAGHEVVFGVRNPEKPELREMVGRAEGQLRAGSIGDALRSAEVVLLALPGKSVESFLDQHAATLGGKVVIDATNQFGSRVVNSMGGIRDQAPDARAFRAFNSIGWEVFADPNFAGGQPDLFYCGPEGTGRGDVEMLIRQAGLRPVYVGGPEQAAIVDAVGQLWVALVFGQGRPRHVAFKLLE